MLLMLNIQAFGILILYHMLIIYERQGDFFVVVYFENGMLSILEKCTLLGDCF